MKVATFFTIGLLLLGSSAFGHSGGGWHMDGWPMMGGGMWCLLFWVVVAIVVVLIIIFGARYVATRGAAGKADKSSLDILKERYAKGEISKTEFDEMKRDLEE